MCRRGRTATLEGMSTRLAVRPRLRIAKVLTGAYLVLSLGTLVAIVLLRNTGLVNDAAWVRGTIVAASSALTFAFAMRGTRRAYLRLRIVAGVMLVAIAVIIALPGTFPLWMKVEQGICGLLLLGLRPWSGLDWEDDRS